MPETFWISFRIGHGGNGEARYQALLAAVRNMTATIWWTESVNFILFASNDAIDQIAEAVHHALDPHLDLALVARTDAKEARAIGRIEDPLLYELMPYAVHYQD